MSEAAQVLNLFDAGAASAGPAARSGAQGAAGGADAGAFAGVFAAAGLGITIAAGAAASLHAGAAGTPGHGASGGQAGDDPPPPALPDTATDGNPGRVGQAVRATVFDLIEAARGVAAGAENGAGAGVPDDGGDGAAEQTLAAAPAGAGTEAAVADPDHEDPAAAARAAASLADPMIAEPAAVAAEDIDPEPPSGIAGSGTDPDEQTRPAAAGGTDAAPDPAAALATAVDPALGLAASAAGTPARAAAGGGAGAQADTDPGPGARAERAPFAGGADDAGPVAARQRGADAGLAGQRPDHPARPPGGEIGERSGSPSALFQANSEPSVFASPTETAQSVVRAALQPGVGVALPLRTIAVHMAQRLADGVREFRIRLDPPELGRIDIRMEITRDGHLSAHLITDRPEALDALQRDARALERALQAAGLDLEEGDLSFNLRGNGARGEGEQADRSDGTPGEAGETGAEPEAAIGRTMRLGALDITV